MQKTSKKEKPITFRMRSFLKPSQNASFLEQCSNLTLLQHYLRKSCILTRFNNDKEIDTFKTNFVHNYENLNPLGWKKLVNNYQLKQNTQNKKLTDEPIYKQLKEIIDTFTEEEKEKYWLDYYKIYKKVVYRTTDLNYLYIKFKEDNKNLNHCHSDIYQSFCQQFAIVFSNYEQGFTKLPKKAKNTITIGFKGTSFALFKHEMPKRYQQEFDEIQNKQSTVNKINKKCKKLMYLNGLGLVEYVYHKKDFDLNKVSTVKLTLSKTGKYYLDFCYDLIQDPKVKEKYDEITDKSHNIDMEKDFVGYDWSISQDNWLVGSKGFNISFDKDCSMHSKKVIKTQKQLDNYKNQHKLFLFELFKTNSKFNYNINLNNNLNANENNTINPNYFVELKKVSYPKIDKTTNSHEYIDLLPIEKIVKIESCEELEKELKSIQKYQELDNLFVQLINNYKGFTKNIKTNLNKCNNVLSTKTIKELYKTHDKLVDRIKAKEKTLSTIWEKIGFKRKDLVCKTAIDILNREEKYITFEELNTSSMMNNWSQGENSYQFKPLRKKLGNSIYREIIERTILRAYRIGKVVITINPKYTSMDCNKCSKRNLFLKLSDKFFQCLGCQHVEHRDLNASKNIEYKGIKEVLYTKGLSSFNNAKQYNQKYKKVLKEIEGNEKKVVNTDGQVSIVVV